MNDYILKYNKFSLSKEKCGIYTENQKKLKKIFIIVLNVNNFYVYHVFKIIKIKDNHNNISHRSYGALCKKHSNTYDSYCIKYKKNLYDFCKIEHEFHDIIEQYKFNYSKEQKRN